MKKVSNKYRNNSSSNSAIYSLNYKFDSNSIAGKISGTALDLIKRYNDFAKEAQANNDYVNAEIFRQYAEHYRKIVTEINERKNQQRTATMETTENSEGVENQVTEENPVAEQKLEEVQKSTEMSEDCNPEKAKVEAKKESKKSFKIIEISHAKTDEAKTEKLVAEQVEEPKVEEITKPKRIYRRRNVVVATTGEIAATANS